MAFFLSLRSFFVLILSALVFTACGGGGSDAPPVDTTPTSFSITLATDVVAGAEVTSGEFTITGINTAVNVSITGGTFSIAGGSFGTSGTVTNNQTIRVRIQASSDPLGLADATISVGGVSATFSARTALSFASSTDVLPGATNIESPTAIEITGFDAVQSIAVSNGEYSVDGGTTYLTSGNVENGQTLRVRADAATTVSTDAVVSVNIGGIVGTYTVTTMADTVEPTVNVLFPPENSMTSGDAIVIRGTAQDDLSGVAAVSVNGVAAISSDGYVNWQATFPLSEGQNTLDVYVSDQAGNEDLAAGQVRVFQDSSRDFYPDDSVQVGEVLAMVYDEAENRILMDGGDLERIVSVDLLTGQRTIFSDENIADSNVDVGEISSIVLGEGDEAWVASSSGLYSLDRSSGVRTFLASNTLPNSDIPLPNGIFLDDSPLDPEILLMRSVDGFVSIDKNTGFKELVDLDADFSVIGNSAYGFYDEQRNRYVFLVWSGVEDAEIGLYALNLDDNSVSPFSTLTTHPDNIAFETPRAPVLVGDVIVVNNFSEIIKIDAESGERTLFIDSETSSGANSLGLPTASTVVPGAGYVFVVNQTGNVVGEILAVDIESGNKVIVTKWFGPET